MQRNSHFRNVIMCGSQSKKGKKYKHTALRLNIMQYMCFTAETFIKTIIIICGMLELIHTLSHICFQRQKTINYIKHTFLEIKVILIPYNGWIRKVPIGTEQLMGQQNNQIALCCIYLFIPQQRLFVTWSCTFTMQHGSFAMVSQCNLQYDLFFSMPQFCKWLKTI